MRIACRAVVCALATTASCGSAFQFSLPATTTSWQTSLASNYHPKPERKTFNSNHLLHSTTKSTGAPSNGRRILHLHPLQATVAPEFASDLSPGVDAINAQNSELCGMLRTMRTRPFFRLYSVDILASCEYMPQELFECYSESCEIYPVDDDEVPEQLKSVDFQEYDFELDGWARWDMPTEDYYDTAQFPEEFTGYDGADVWRFIHNRIAFNGDGTLRDAYDNDSWKADFNRAVSGLHAMVSAQCCRGIGDKIAAGQAEDNETDWTDPRAEFDRRLGPGGETPKAIENLYFTYMLLLTAVAKARDRLLADCASGKIDAATASELKPVLSHVLLDDPSVAAASKKLLDHAAMDDGSLWEVRMRVRELMRIMNCVQCNKCRLHGKISVMGVSTALNLLLGDTGAGGDAKKMHRVDLAALMTALGKFSTAVDYCQSMLKA